MKSLIVATILVCTTNLLYSQITFTPTKPDNGRIIPSLLSKYKNEAFKSYRQGNTSWTSAFEIDVAYEVGSRAISMVIKGISIFDCEFESNLGVQKNNRIELLRSPTSDDVFLIYISDKTAFGNFLANPSQIRITWVGTLFIPTQADFESHWVRMPNMNSSSTFVLGMRVDKINMYVGETLYETWY